MTNKHLGIAICRHVEVDALLQLLVFAMRKTNMAFAVRAGKSVLIAIRFFGER